MLSKTPPTMLRLKSQTKCRESCFSYLYLKGLFDHPGELAFKMSNSVSDFLIFCFLSFSDLESGLTLAVSKSSSKPSIKKGRHHPLLVPSGACPSGVAFVVPLLVRLA